MNEFEMQKRQPISNVQQCGSSTSINCAKETEIKGNCKHWLNIEVVVLCVLIIGVWSLLSLPVIFYHLPVSEKSSSTTTKGTAPSGNSVCSAPLKYTTTNGICLTELVNVLASSHCLPDPEGNILVVRNNEITATQLVKGLSSFGSSAECRTKGVPFFCQYLFGICGGSGVSILPTSSQCEEVRDIVCQQEWMFIEGLGMELPDCAMLPPEASSCPDDSDSTFDKVLKKVLEKHQLFLNETTLTDLECTEGFYQENSSSVCTPSCYTWLQYNKQLSVFIDVVAFTSASVAFVACGAVIIISCLLHKRMLTIPSIFIVYMMIDVIGLGLIVMIGYMDRNNLFCSSRSLIESLGEVTPFCVINGIFFTYLVGQVTLWWLFHVISIFLKVIFPFHVRLSSKAKYIHIMCVILGILLPLVPVITSMAKFAVDTQKQSKSSFQLRKSSFLSGGLGFGPSRFPPIFCSGTDPDAIFYSFVLIVDILLASGCTLLLIIFWSVHKIYKRKRAKQNFKSKINETFKFETAEKKLLIVFCYYVVLAAIFLTQFTLTTRNASQLRDSVEKYFFCEQSGNNLCDRSAIEHLNSASLEILSDITLALLPIVNLLYAVNIQELKELWSKLVHKQSFASSSI